MYGALMCSCSRVVVCSSEPRIKHKATAGTCSWSALANVSPVCFLLKARCQSNSLANQLSVRLMCLDMCLLTPHITLITHRFYFQLVSCSTSTNPGDITSNREKPWWAERQTDWERDTFRSHSQSIFISQCFHSFALFLKNSELQTCTQKCSA